VAAIWSRVSASSRISGGASRQTYRFRLTWTEGGARRERRLILRRQDQQQGLAVFPADLPRRIAPLPHAIQHGQAIGEGGGHDFFHEARPFGLGYRGAAFHIPPEIGFRDGGWPGAGGAGRWGCGATRQQQQSAKR
jgi:hypothetical protein